MLMKEKAIEITAKKKASDIMMEKAPKKKKAKRHMLIMTKSRKVKVKTPN